MIHKQKFPMVNRRTNEVSQGTIFYSLGDPQLSITWSKVTFHPETDLYWYVDPSLMIDKNTSKSVVSSLRMLCANPGSFLWTDVSDSLSGASLGLAVALAIYDEYDKNPFVDCTVCSTGYLNAFEGHESSDRIYQIDKLSTKIEHYSLLGLPLICSQDQLSDSKDEIIRVWWKSGKFYTPMDFIRRDKTPYDPNYYVAACCLSLIEAKEMAEYLCKFYK